MSGITDFHSHLIPGVDDGAPDCRASVAAIERLRADGVKRIITTPHFDASLIARPDRFARRIGELDLHWDLLRQELRNTPQLADSVELWRGVELMLDAPCPSISDPRLRLGGGSFVLVEFPGFALPPINPQLSITCIRAQGLIPVIAHPERYLNAGPSLEVLGAFREGGAYLAVNARSVFGGHGAEAAARARHLFARGWVDYVVSDYHAVGDPGVARFVRTLRESGHDEHAELLTVVNPERLAKGEPPMPVPPVQGKHPLGARPLWARLFAHA